MTTQLPQRSIREIATAVRDLYKEIVVRDEPEAQQFAGDLNRSYIRATRILLKKESPKVAGGK